ncbi:MAG: YbhB/YbcL family Raf kinase inhibitor-like protein [Myxococcaceae bacterium]|jgi:phosphatidylethanolamine-binding protein (PEBP) family uncharacterized protein|nr:YbhB/YbcL family Raf kinase inhibitor-like protein [Myxococcaceae bacterium]
MRWALVLGVVLQGCGAMMLTADAGLDAGVADDAGARGDAGSFRLSGPGFVEGGDGGLVLPREYTCDVDGGGLSPPLAWAGVPAGTVEFALVMTTVARDGLKYNWVVWGIPGAVRALSAGSTGGGVAGLTSDGPQLAYAPPCSQGPGAKSYTFTLAALSAPPRLSSPAAMERGDVLEADIAPVTLGRASITVSSTRP